MSFEGVKEKMETILNSENTKNILFNKFKNIPITKSIPILNLLINDVFIKEENVLVFNHTDSIVSDLVINNKKILVRLNSLKYKSKRLSFCYFPFTNEEEFLIEDIIDQANFRLNNYSFIFLIRVEEEKHCDKLKRCIHYYLFPTDVFKIDEKEKEFNVKIQKERLEKKDLLK